MTNKISIVLATYNGAIYLKQQLDSIALQTLLPNELVVCDDGSTDATCEIIESFKETAPFEVRLYRNLENLGYARNFAQALSLCKGDVIFLSDQDDEWMPQKLEVVLSYFAIENNTQVIIHDLEFCDGNLIPIGQKKIERLQNVVNLSRDYVTGMATAVNRDFLELCFPFPYKAFSHDAWIHLCAHYVGVKKILPLVLANYRRHDSNATSHQLINRPVKVNFLSLHIDKFKKIFSFDYSDSIARHVVLMEWLIKNRDVLIYRFNVYPSQINKSVSHIKVKLLILKFLLKTSIFKKFLGKLKIVF